MVGECTTYRGEKCELSPSLNWRLFKEVCYVQRKLMEKNAKVADV